MVDDLSGNPIIQTIGSVANLIGVFNANHSNACHLLSYADGFNQLWDFPALKKMVSKEKSSNRFIVIRDDERLGSSDAPEAARYLSSLDWAISAGLYLFNSKNRYAVLPQMTIVDFGGSERNTNADQFLNLFTNESTPAPWVRRVKVAPISGGNNFCTLMAELGSKAEPVKVTHEQIKMLRQIWQSFFLQPAEIGANHALANVVGASMLLGDFGSSPTRRALDTHLTNLLLVPDKIRQQDVNGNSTLSSIFTEFLSTGSKLACNALNFFLVDDAQRRHRWFEYVSQQLGTSTSEDAGDDLRVAQGELGGIVTNLVATDQAAVLLEVVKAAIENLGKQNESTARNNRLQVGKLQTIDVLLLDLRLFEGQSLEVEAQFYLSVVEIFLQLLQRSDKLDRGRPIPDEADLESAKDWCKDAIKDGNQVARSDGQYIEIITLLPRLIAVVDQDLPTVLFSSTRRRRVSEILKPYRNMVTSFVKPTLQIGQDSSTLQNISDQFSAAIAKALELTRARRLRCALEEKEFALRPSFTLEEPKGAPKQGDWHVQLLLDETGTVKNKDLIVGGMLVFYPPGISPKDLTESFGEQELLSLRGKSNTRYDKLLGQVTKVNKHLKSIGAMMVPITLAGASTAYSSWEASSTFKDESVADNLHRELLRRAVEISLFVVARKLLAGRRQVDFSFHAPTRVLPVDSKEAQKLDEVWGIQSDERSGELMANHIERSSARPLLDEVLRSYSESDFLPTPVLARAYQLNKKLGAKEERKVHVLHYIADAWLSKDGHKGLEEFDSLAVTGRHGAQLATLLEANRLLSRGDVTSAVAIGAKVAIGMSPDEKTVVSDAILHSIKKASLAMTGPESMELAAKLGVPEAEVAPTRLIGLVVQDSGDVLIEAKNRQFRWQRKGDARRVKKGDRVEFTPERTEKLGYKALNVTVIGNSESGTK